MRITPERSEWGSTQQVLPAKMLALFPISSEHSVSPYGTLLLTYNRLLWQSRVHEQNPAYESNLQSEIEEV